MQTTTLYRPVGPEELALIAESDWTKFPPRLPEQPIFYPVLNEEYAITIARDWNVPASGVGYVTRFEVTDQFLEGYEIHTVGSKLHRELWIPAEDIEQFNNNIVGRIELIHSFSAENSLDGSR